MQLMCTVFRDTDDFHLGGEVVILTGISSWVPVYDDDYEFFVGIRYVNVLGFAEEFRPAKVRHIVINGCTDGLLSDTLTSVFLSNNIHYPGSD